MEWQDQECTVIRLTSELDPITFGRLLLEKLTPRIQLFASAFTAANRLASHIAFGIVLVLSERTHTANKTGPEQICTLVWLQSCASRIEGTL